MTVQQTQLFCFGLGYSATHLAGLAHRSGWSVTGTVRGAEKAAALAAPELDVAVFDGASPVSVPKGADWLISVPPSQEGCPVWRAHLTQIPQARSITYVSTTGVYGDLAGGWAFEWSRVNPRTDRAKARVVAEAQWLSTGVPTSLVRLPGIYGPGRSPFNRLRAGTARRIIKPGQVFSRVHVDDIAQGLFALIANRDAHGVFHFTDDWPAPPQDVISFAAACLDAAPPPETAFDAAALSPMARSFYGECKRVSNARAKAVLGWRPQYATYREGLPAVLAAESASASGGEGRRLR